MESWFFCIWSVCRQGLIAYQIYCWTGMIDEFRITKGQAVYQVNFEPPIQEFPNS